MFVGKGLMLSARSAKGNKLTFAVASEMLFRIALPRMVESDADEECSLEEAAGFAACKHGDAQQKSARKRKCVIRCIE